MLNQVKLFFFLFGGTQHCLCMQAPFDKVEPLVYKYSASLMAADPAGTIDAWWVCLAFLLLVCVLVSLVRVRTSTQIDTDRSIDSQFMICL